MTSRAAHTCSTTLGRVDPLDPTDTELYATFLDLGLQQADDVDGLIVLDLDADGSFSQVDVVLFSLAPGITVTGDDSRIAGGRVSSDVWGRADVVR